jgi:hypothetical protein
MNVWLLLIEHKVNLELLAYEEEERGMGMREIN